MTARSSAKPDAATEPEDDSQPVACTPEQLAAMPDSEIDYSDIPKTDAEFWKNARVVMPEDRQKKQVTIRLDPDVLSWFKAQGAGYQTRMNAVLRSYYEAHVSK